MRTLDILILIAVVFTLLTPCTFSAPTKTLVDGFDRLTADWSFDSPADVKDWIGNGSVTDLAVKDGCLTGRTIGGDPILTGPLFEIPASPYQFVEIKLRTSRTGYGELYWSNTTDEPYGGFRPGWYRVMEYTAGDFRIYRFFPFWQDLGKIIHLRLDPPEGVEFAVDYIRICEVTASSSSNAFFDFSKPDQLWMSAYGLQPKASQNGIALAGSGEKMLVSPKLDLDADSYSWLSVMIKAAGAESAVLTWVTDDLPGVGSYTISLKPDDKWHVYNIAAEELADWIGRIRMLALSFSTTKGLCPAVKFAGASAEPKGPAELEVTHFGWRDAVNRAGNPAAIQALLRNVGGEPLKPFRINMGYPPEFRKIGMLDPNVPALKPGESRLLTWEIQGDKPGTFGVWLDILGAQSQPMRIGKTLRLDPAVSIGRSDYVPEPNPVRGEFEVGMYYFPGWHNYERWAVLNEFPERRPILGYYREGDPEVADWHIKWMVEHGVTFIIYDWYWSAGGRMLEHALHNGFFNAKYRDKIKFCLLWANHNPPNTSSPEDMVNVTNYWLDNYFLRPEYFKVDGKPVVVIFSTGRLTDDLGVEGVRKAFDKSREMARARGLAGIYFVGCTFSGNDRLKILEQEGYDALSGYNYAAAGDKGRIRAPYDDMVTGYQEVWKAIADSTALRYIPVTEPGWDSRPWHGQNARVRTGKTPDKFKKMLENAKQFVEERTPDAKPKMVIVEAWNEFGEGDFTEPHQEFGFGHVDAIREVFTTAPKIHSDVIPQDIGLGPYDIPVPKLVTSWEFDDPDAVGWDASQGLKDAKVADGLFTAISVTNDPAFYGGMVSIMAKKFTAVEIRMKVDKGKGGQLFWAGYSNSFTEAASMGFDLIPDGEFHVYRLDLASSPAWKARIDRLRLDPTDAANALIQVDYIRFIF